MSQIKERELISLKLWHYHLGHFFTSENVQKKRKRTHGTSSKLWHYRLGHISRGRTESLVKNEILPPLELSDLEQCVDCVKGKYVKQIKKRCKAKHMNSRENSH
jgi:hypothetical protein